MDGTSDSRLGGPGFRVKVRARARVRVRGWDGTGKEGKGRVAAGHVFFLEWFHTASRLSAACHLTLWGRGGVWRMRTLLQSDIHTYMHGMCIQTCMQGVQVMYTYEYAYVYVHDGHPDGPPQHPYMCVGMYHDTGDTWDTQERGRGPTYLLTYLLMLRTLSRPPYFFPSLSLSLSL